MLCLFHMHHFAFVFNQYLHYLFLPGSYQSPLNVYELLLDVSNFLLGCCVIGAREELKKKI